MEIIKLLESFATDVLILALPVFYAAHLIDKKLGGRHPEITLLAGFLVSVILSLGYCLIFLPADSAFWGNCLSKGLKIFLVSFLYKMLSAYYKAKSKPKKKQKDTEFYGAKGEKSNLDPKLIKLLIIFIEIKGRKLSEIEICALLQVWRHSEDKTPDKRENGGNSS